MNAMPKRWLPAICMLAGVVFAQGTDPGTQNLTHSWTFNDGTADDPVGGANGTLMGDAVIIDGTLIFSDKDQWMEMSGEDIALYAYDEITLEAWFLAYEGANTGYHMLAYFGDTLGGVGVNGYFITPARGDNKSRAAITCGVLTNPWSGESGADGPEYDDAILHHMVSTLNGTDITLYIDGELTGSTPLSATNSILQISPNCAYLGKGGYGADPTWIGEIHAFNIYNRALTADEIFFLSYKNPDSGVMNEKTGVFPQGHLLAQNYPNPFNPATAVTFDLPMKSAVRIAVYDLSGREVARLVDEVRPSGRYTVSFNGENLGSGVYVCRMDIGTQVFTRKMTLLK